jgi:tellurite resistance protein TerC
MILTINAAIILRGIFVAAGAATLQEFHQVLLLFSAILAYSSFKVLFGGDDEEEEVRNCPLLLFAFTTNSISLLGYI